jgi:nicotinamidase-related amidase
MLVRDACLSFDEAWHRATVEFAVTQLGEVATIDDGHHRASHAQAA